MNQRVYGSSIVGCNCLNKCLYGEKMQMQFITEAEYKRICSYLIGESCGVVRDKVKVCLEQVQVAVMHILSKRYINLQLSTPSLRSYVAMLVGLGLCILCCNQISCF